MKTSRNYTATEKVIISMATDKVKLFDCSIHGVFSLLKENINEKCPHNCKGIITNLNTPTHATKTD